MFLLMFILALPLVMFLLIDSKIASCCSNYCLIPQKLVYFLDCAKFQNFLFILGQVFEREYLLEEYSIIYFDPIKEHLKCLNYFGYNQHYF